MGTREVEGQPVQIAILNGREKGKRENALRELVAVCASDLSMEFMGLGNCTLSDINIYLKL